MSLKRRSYEAGHKPKFLVVIDETPECDRAVYFASRRAARIGASVVMLLRDRDAGPQSAMARRRRHHEGGGARGGQPDARRSSPARANGVAGITPERVIREGETVRGDPQADRGGRGHRHPGAGRRHRQGRPGPAGHEPRQDRRRPIRSRSRSCRGISATKISTRCLKRIAPVIDLAGPQRTIYCGRCQRWAASAATATERPDVHPDRSHAQSGDPEVPARPHRARRPARSTCATRTRPRKSPLAERLFDIDGVGGVFFGSDFITVTKTGRRMAAAQARDPRRHHGALHVRRAAAGGGARAATPTKPASSSRRGDAETVATIKELIETRVRPAVANDGGDITFRGFKDGVVYLT